MLRPVQLRTGDKVKLVAPAGPVSGEKFDKLVQLVSSLGLEPVWSRQAKAQYGYFSGTDTDRLHDLVNGLSDKSIKAVFCLRGGYGSTRLLSSIPYSLIRRNPKVFLGFSDITALQMAFLKKTGLITFHTSLAALSNEYTRLLFKQLVFDGFATEIDMQVDFAPQPLVINHGQAEGVLLGGNLSLLVSLIGTGYLPPLRNKVVFIEEIAEPPYKIDRMITHLLMATDLSRAGAIILGIFNKCEWNEYYDSKEKAFSLEEIFRDRFSYMNVPVIYGFPLGHVDKMSILPMGAKVKVDTQTLKIKLIKPVVR